jgi:phosphate transport system substrate-binding protein
MLKQCRIALILTVAMAITVFLSACGSTDTGSGSTTRPSTLGTPGAYNCVQGSITAAGSTALAPLVQAVAQAYQAKCSGASITVNLGGSGAGLTGVEAGNIQIGNSDIFKKSGQDDLIDHQVAVVVFTLIVNSKVTGVTNLTTEQIKGIYSGKITNWKDLNGPNLPVTVISRPTSSGTRATFQKYVLGGPETISGPTNLTSDSTGTVVTNVKQTDGAIGYVALGPTKSSGLTILSIDGVAPSADTAKNNTYKFWNIEHMYTKGAATGLAQALIDYMLSDDGKQAAAKLDFVAITEMQAAALQTHQPAA